MKLRNKLNQVSFTHREHPWKGITAVGLCLWTWRNAICTAASFWFNGQSDFAASPESHHLCPNHFTFSSIAVFSRITLSRRISAPMGEKYSFYPRFFTHYKPAEANMKHDGGRSLASAHPLSLPHSPHVLFTCFQQHCDFPDPRDAGISCCNVHCREKNSARTLTKNQGSTRAWLWFSHIGCRWCHWYSVFLLCVA